MDNNSMNGKNGTNDANYTNNVNNAGNTDSPYTFQTGADAFANYTAPNNYTTYTNTTPSTPVVKENRRALGFLGALGGALIGGLVWTAIGCLGFISGWIAILIFFLAQAGYKKLNREQDLFGVIISLILGLIIIIPATYASYGFSLWRNLVSEFGRGFSYFEVLADMPLYMNRYGLWGNFIQNLVMGYIFTGIAAVFVGADAVKGRKRAK